MSDNSTLPKIPFSQIVKHPQLWMMMVGISIAWFFIYQFAGVSGQVNKNCEAEKVALRADNIRKDERIDALTNAILYYKGINVEYKKTTDSLIREKVGNEAKTIIK